MLLGIDVGGTKTTWMTYSENFGVSEFEVCTSSWRREDYAVEDWHRLADYIRTKSPWTQPDRIVVGACGCNDDASLQLCADSFKRATGWDATVVNDAELVGAQYACGGISLIVGTGCIAVARDARGELVSAGGWGWLIGDDGGGAGLVRAAIRSSLSAADCGDPDSDLSCSLKKSLEVPNLNLANQKLMVNASSREFARHARVVFEAAQRDCPLAKAVTASGAAAVAGLIARLMARGIRGPVIAGGGILNAQPAYFDLISKQIRSLKGTIAILARHPPVQGAIKLASMQRSTGCQWQSNADPDLATSSVSKCRHVARLGQNKFD